LFLGFGSLAESGELAAPAVVLERHRQWFQESLEQALVLQCEALRRSRQQEDHSACAGLADQGANQEVCIEPRRYDRLQRLHRAITATTKRHLAAMTPGDKVSQVVGGTVVPLAQEPQDASSRTQAHGLESRALRFKASHDHLLEGHPALQELGNIGGRRGYVGRPTGFAPHFQQEVLYTCHA
jgi:hypothetical protein